MSGHHCMGLEVNGGIPLPTKRVELMVYVDYKPILSIMKIINIDEPLLIKMDEDGKIEDVSPERCTICGFTE